MAWGAKALGKAFSGWGKEGSTFLGRAGENFKGPSTAFGKAAMFVPNVGMWSVAQVVKPVKFMYNKAPATTVILGGLGTTAAVAATLKPSTVPNQLAPEAQPVMDPNMVAANVEQALAFTDPNVADQALTQMDPNYGKMMQASNQIMAQSAERGMMMSPEQIAAAQAAANQPSMV